MTPVRLLFAAALFGAGMAASAAPATAEPPPLRPEVGKPLQAAQELIKQKKFREALAKIHEVEGETTLTPYEAGLAAHLRGIAASGAGDPLTAARAFETVITSGQIGGEDRLRLTQAVGGLYYQAQSYDKAIEWIRRYLESGGSDEGSKTLLAQAQYLNQDYAAAARTLREQIAAAEQAGRTPPEASLQLLANAGDKLNDPAGNITALEKLLAAYPKAEYWKAAIQRVRSKPGFAERLSLDALRLGLAAGTLSETAEFIEGAELAIQANLPGEAKAFLDKGVAAGLIGRGPDAERHQRLRALAEQRAEADRRTLDQSEREAAQAKDGAGLVNTGLAYAAQGQAAKGLALIEQGVAKGGLRQPEDARLRLGVVALAAGQKDKAVQTLKAVGGTDGAADLARLWTLRAQARG
jgi:tetratricopeptide (TPR) repeat protein